MFNLKPKQTDPLQEDVHNALAHVAACTKTHATVCKKLDARRARAAALQTRIAAAEADKDFPRAVSLRQTAGTEAEIIAATEAEVDTLAAQTADAERLVGRAARKLFLARFEQLADDMRADLVNLAALFKLAHADCTPREPWLTVALRETLNRANIHQPSDIDQAAAAIRAEALK